jgi:uncharacterized phage-associated protein
MDKTTDIKPIEQGKYSAAEVADYFVHLASQKFIDEGVPEGVSPLKLQKFLYFGQAASLALFNKKLFREDIEAWQYGPVISSIYHQYKIEGNTPLTQASGEYKVITDESDQDFIKDVWKLFDKFSASELVEMTHQHGPWLNTYKEGEKHVVITPELMRDYYKDVFQLDQETDVKE